MKNNFYSFLLILLFFSSCVSYKNVPYFQDIKGEGVSEEEIKNYSLIRIQKDDILAITVTSLNQEASALFNMGNTSSNPNNTVSGNVSPSATANGFLVDQLGNIQLPLVGNIMVQGLSTIEARELIQKKLVDYLKEPIVSLRIVNFKISVLGDVARPGVYSVQNERASITDALGMAGDLTITAVRNNVLLVREKEGKRQFIRIDLTNRNIFNSPNYYLRNNDVVYVQPGKSKVASSDVAYRNVSLILSALSVIGLLISRL